MLDANIRARGEVIDGQYRAGLPADDAALLFRTDVSATYARGSVRLGLEILDSRVYFERKHSSVSANEVDALEPIQAYVAAELGRGMSVQAGRFTMDLGSRRLVARPINRNDFNSFTGVRFDWKDKGGDRFTGFWTMPQNRMPEDVDGVHANRFQFDQERFERQLFGATGTRTGVMGGTAELYGYRFVERDAPGFATRNRHLWTTGIRVSRAPKTGTLDYDMEAAWQSGTSRLTLAASDVADKRVSAWMGHAALGWSFAAPWSPRLAINADYMTGDRPGGGFGRFDGLVGDPAYEFTPSGLYSLIIRSNLATVSARVEARPDARTDLHVNLRPIWLATATDSFGNSGVRDPSGKAGHFVGTHIDTRLRYWMVPERLQLGIGGALLFKGRFLKEAPNAPHTGNTRYGFLDATAFF